MADDHVTVELADAVGRLVLDRSESNNSMTDETARAMKEAAIDLSTDDDVRCIVLTGAGATFNTGADLSMLSGDDSDARTLKTTAGELHEFVVQLSTAPKPVLCAVNGVVAGGGIGPALCGDVVLMAGSARFEFAYPAIGLSADGGSSYFLPRLVGLREAQRIAMRNEPVDAAEAVDLGLVTERVPDDEFDARVREEAAALAAGPTKAHAETRRLLRTSFEHGLEAQLSREAERIAGLADTGDYQRGLEAFFEKAEPEFEGR